MNSINKKMKKSLIFFFVILCGIFQLSYSQDIDATSSIELNLNNESINYENDSYMFADALKAYSNRDWKTAVFLFKKFHSNQKNISQESLYMLIMAETFNDQYKLAISDCDLFIKKFPNSQYLQFVKYQKGKNLFCVADFEKSIIILSDFCHLYPRHQLYVHSLYLIAENFYFTYNFENAKPIYERIVAEFPDSQKSKEAQYRLDILAQRSREDKLLYLLKQTGEDYLSSREAYEKAIKQSKVENAVDLDSQIKELRDKNEALDSDLIKEKNRSAKLEEQLKLYEEDYQKSIKLLKEQAEELYQIIGE